MANMLDYLDWRGDLTFSERPLNEVDSLIFCELSYIEMDGIVPSPESGEFISLSRLSEAYAAREKKQEDLFFNDPAPLLMAASRSPRFRDLQLGRYVNHVDPDSQVQFSAYVIRLPDECLYVAYRGTDNSVVGWREDFNFAFSEETEGQREATEYLEEAARLLPGRIYVGGHSKGGNLAVYAAAFSDPALRERLLRIFSHDGPGFMEKVVNSEAYRSLQNRVELYLPETSVVGILLDNRGRRTVLRSSGTGVMQHDPMTWQVRGTAFEQVDGQSSASVFMDKTLHKWLSGLEPEQRRVFVTTLFDAMDQSGAKTLTEMGADSYGAILRTMLELEPEKRSEIFSALKKLSSASHDVFWTEAKTRLQLSLNRATARLRRQKEEDLPPALPESH